MPNPEITYNLAGALGHTLTPESLDKLQKGLVTSGYDGGHFFPFRGTDLDKKPFLPINFIEMPWNPGHQFGLLPAIVSGVAGHLQRQLYVSSQAPLLVDHLFPSSQNCQGVFDSLCLKYPDAYIISYNDPHKQKSLSNPRVYGYDGRRSLTEFLEITHENPIFFDPHNIDHRIKTRSVIFTSGPTVTIPPWSAQLFQMSQTN